MSKSKSFRKGKTGPHPPMPATNRQPPNVAPKPRSIWWWLAAGAFFLAMCYITYWGATYFFFAKIPNELVGLWVIEGGDQDGATIDFQRNGRFQANLNVGGRLGKIDAWAEVHGKEIHLIDTNPHDGSVERNVHLIKELSDNRLTLQFQDGKSYDLVRAQ